MPKAINQKAKPCSTCPFLRTGGDRTKAFEPEALERTVFDYMRNGGIHPCHSRAEDMCAGYLAFAEKNFPQGGAASF